MPTTRTMAHSFFGVGVGAQAPRDPRVPDAVQRKRPLRAAVHRRSGTATDTVPVTVPGLQRITARCAEPGTQGLNALPPARPPAAAHAGAAHGRARAGAVGLRFPVRTGPHLVE